MLFYVMLLYFPRLFKIVFAMLIARQSSIKQFISVHIHLNSINIRTHTHTHIFMYVCTYKCANIVLLQRLGILYFVSFWFG